MSKDIEAGEFDAICESTHMIADQIEEGRRKAHAKHGENSIEGIHALDPRWLPILVEEVGEVAQAMNDGDLGLFDSDERLRQVRAELIDVATVAVAWIASLDRGKTCRCEPGHWCGCPDNPPGLGVVSQMDQEIRRQSDV